MRSISLSIFNFLVMLLMIAPAFGVVRVWPINSASIDAAVFLLSGLLVGAGFLGSKDANLKISMPTVFFIALLGTLTVSVLLNTYSFEASWRWYFVCLTIAVFVTLAASEVKARNPESFSLQLAKALFLGALIYCVSSLAKYFGILSFVFPWIEASEGRLAGVWHQPNLTTTVAWLGLVSASVVLAREGSRLFLSSSILIFGWVIASAASRMSWLILFALMVLVLVSLIPKYDSIDTRSARRGLGFGLLAILLMLVIVPEINSPLRGYLVELEWIEGTTEVALTDRAVTQDVARISELSKLASEFGHFSVRQLLVGVGPGNYPSFSFQADMSQAPENLVSSTWLHSHNLFTMIFVEFGMVGLMLTLIGLFFIIKVSLSNPIDPRRFFAIGCLGIIFIHSNLEFPLWYPWFIVVTCLLLVNLFDTKTVHAETKALKPVLGSLIAIMAVALVINLGYQYGRIAKVAMASDPNEEQYLSLSLLANDSLMGPYAILRKYRDFAPESTNLDWQLNEAQRMKAWQPRDLVLLREYSILVLKGDVDEACNAAETTAYRYPRSAPIMLEHAIKSGVLTPQQTIRLANCIEMGLAPRGETIPSVQQKNQRSLSRM